MSKDEREEYYKGGFYNGYQRAKAAVQWLPVETAPKDGSHILLYRPDICFVGYYAKDGWVTSAPGLPLMEPPPTHWMPLPKPPEWPKT